MDFHGAASMNSDVPKLDRKMPAGASHPTVAATFVTLQLGKKAVRYAVCSMGLPLSELLATFLEDMNLPTDAYALAYEGTVVPPRACATTLGLLPASVRLGGCVAEGESWVVSRSARDAPPGKERVNVLRVVPRGWAAAREHIACINRLGEVLCIDRAGAEQPAHLSEADVLSVVFAHLSFEDLLSVCQACVLWHLVAQRTSLLLQLQGGHWTSLDGLASPAFLKLLHEYSHKLSRAQLQAEARAVRQQRAACGAKEAKPGRHAYMWGGTRPHQFTKASGCTTMRTVQADAPEESLRQLSLGLQAARTQCFTALPGGGGPSSSCALGGGGGAGAPADDVEGLDGLGTQLLREQLERRVAHDLAHAVEDVLTVGGVEATCARRLGAPVAPPQVEPLAPPAPAPAAAGQATAAAATRVVAAASDELRQMSVALFRKYFSPDMYYIFPLLAYRQALCGLDFTRVNTWAILHGEQPVGAIAWRFVAPPLAVEARERGARGALEVLFIGVWEQYRDHQCGSESVAALEAVARAQPGCAMLYVEIGHEQPKARQFWGNNGFELVNSSPRSRAAPEQLLFFENACLRFSDTEQWVKVLDS